MLAFAAAFLSATQNLDGGWGYAPGQASTVEATSAALLALRDLTAGGKGVAWLRAAQHADGGWGIGAGDAESGWPTAWAVLTLARLAGSADAAVSRGMIWLLGVKTLQMTGDGLQRQVREQLAIDVTLAGWPWLPGEATWVEPTALTLLALADAPPSATRQDRMAEAVRFLADRRCHGGGWNFGNPVMLGGQLPARAHPTAWALLALAAVAPQVIRPEDVATLRVEMRRDGGASALAWGVLALRVLGQDDAEAATQLAAQQRPDGSWNANPFHTAVALLAERGRF